MSAHIRVDFNLSIVYAYGHFVIGSDGLTEFEVSDRHEVHCSSGLDGCQLLGDLQQACARHNRVPRKVSGKDRMRGIKTNRERVLVLCYDCIKVIQ